jgi:hypothetical protein
MDEDCINVIGFIVLTATFGAIIWYSIETRGLKKETIKQTRLRLRPLIILFQGALVDELFAINIGNGPALKVKIEDICIINAGNISLTYSFRIIDVLIPQKKEQLKIFIKESNRPAEHFELAAIFPGLTVKPRKFAIRYRDVENNEYKTCD